MTRTDDPTETAWEPVAAAIRRSKGGDRQATDELFRFCLPRLMRRAERELPRGVWGHVDAADIAQDAAIRFLGRIDRFEPRSLREMDGYLHQCVKNKIRDELRRIRGRTFAPLENDSPVSTSAPSPFDDAAGAELRRRYHRALERLDPRKLGLLLCRLELNWTYGELARHFGKPSGDAARMAVRRTLREISITLERQAA